MRRRSVPWRRHCLTAGALLGFSGLALSGLGSVVTAQAPPPVRPFLAALSVSSVARTATWYRDHFGFRLLQMDTVGRPGLAAALLERDGFYLEIVALAGSRPRRDALVNPATNASLQGLYKFGFWVPDADSVAREISRAGIPLYRPLATDSTLAGGTRYFLVLDPDSTVVQGFGPLRRRN